METNEIVILLVVVLVLLAVVAALVAAQRRKREQLRSTFGPEYDRTLDSTGRRRDAERDLAERAERRSSLDIRPLSTADRQAFAARWTATQADFVDRPAEAVTAADQLVSEVMHRRGYPVGDFDQQARDVSVDHAEVVQEYRAAHDISLLNDRQQATTEQLRQAMVHYRALFTELLGEDDVAQAAAPVSPTVDSSRSARDLPDHDLSDRDLAYLDSTDRDSTDRSNTSVADRVEPVDQPLDDRQADPERGGRVGGQLGQSHERARVDAIVEQQEQRGGGSHSPYDDRVAGPRTGHPASHDADYDPAAEDLAATRGADGDPGHDTTGDRRVREGGLLAGDRDEPQVLHVRRERLDDGPADRDLPPRG
jgi:hypothetical protein